MYFYRDAPEKIPWAIPLLHQFRFLDTITNVDIVTTNIEQLLETCPLWFQYELILFLPDILSDIQHQNIAEILMKMLEENYELTNVILNCIASFNLDKEYLEEYKIKVLYLLKTNMKVEFIPIVIRYIYIFVSNFNYYYMYNIYNNFQFLDFFLIITHVLILLNKCCLYYAI